MLTMTDIERFTIGLDFGTSSVRAVVVDTADGSQIGVGISEYGSGDSGVVTDSCNPDLARQNPSDYIEGIQAAVASALAEAGPVAAAAVVGIGVDTTGSTPIPVDSGGTALAFKPEFAENPNAMAWLWKDHTAVAEASEITARAEREHPEYLAKCGGVYSSEWFWAKLLKCARTDVDVFAAAASWVELADWIPAILTGTTALDRLARCICAAGHKAMFNPDWGGYPAEDFISSFDEGVLAKIRRSLPQTAKNISESIGGLTPKWAAKLGLKAGIPVAAGAFDAHLGAVGAGIEPGTMVKVIGTSTCDLALLPRMDSDAHIPGVCGVVPDSILPGYYGVEAGQSAVGDIFDWYVAKLQPGAGLDHAELGELAAGLKPGESGLMALDWNNGNRTILVDQALSGLLMGFNLHSTPGEIFRALIEATAFGARMIRDRLVDCGVPIERVINCGGISVKSPLLMQIYADVFACPMLVSASTQTCALGAAMAGAVVAGVFPDFAAAAKSMTSVRKDVYRPIAANVAVYERLFGIYRRLHDIFGTADYSENQFDLMKELIAIRAEQRSRK
jgi:L-ribulokinase